MDIYYKHKRLYINLILGIVWFIFFILKVFTNEALDWIDYGWLVIALLYLGLYYYQVKYKYLNIKDGYIRLNGPLGKKIQLSKVKQIKKFAGDYILKSEDKEISINTHEIDLDSLKKLNDELNKLKVEWK